MTTIHLDNTERKIHFSYKINLLSQFIFLTRKRKSGIRNQLRERASFHLPCREETE